MSAAFLRPLRDLMGQNGETAILLRFAQAKDVSPRPGRVHSVGEGPNKGAEDHAAPEARDEELPNLPGVITVVLVQSVHVRALQPVSGCTKWRFVGQTSERKLLSGAYSPEDCADSARTHH